MTSNAVQASTMLLEMISTVDSDKIRPLLDRVFPFVGIPELRPIAVAVLSHLQPIPKRNLYMLAEDNDVFWDLPLAVQQQVRACRQLLDVHAPHCVQVGIPAGVGGLRCAAAQALHATAAKLFYGGRRAALCTGHVVLHSQK